MRRYFSIIMMIAAVGCSLLYLDTIKNSGLLAAQSEISFLAPSASSLATFTQVDVEGLLLTPDVNDVYYCFVTEAFMEKLSSYGASAADFLSLSDAQELESETTLTSTSGFIVMNYLKARSETLSKGKTYYLFLGTKNDTYEFTNEQTECIKIQL